MQAPAAQSIILATLRTEDGRFVIIDEITGIEAIRPFHPSWSIWARRMSLKITRRGRIKPIRIGPCGGSLVASDIFGKAQLTADLVYLVDGPQTTLISELEDLKPPMIEQVFNFEVVARLDESEGYVMS